MNGNWCINGVLDESKYSSPVPVIGWYIAAGSFVLLLFMILDILLAVSIRKLWIPCQLFSLNSLTLTLLAISVKIPLDLTTPMPSAQDQLCKLFGTMLLGTSMAFFSRSVANSRRSERLTNMTALTILVMTVMVNIWIQIGTGVIHRYILYHYLMLYFTFGALVQFWVNISRIALKKKRSHEDSKTLFFTNGVGSMLSRLKLCYLHDFMDDPQVRRSKVWFPYCCSLCIATLDCFLSKKINFCEGVSDYKKSMWIIVAIQGLIVIVGFLAECIRLGFSYARSFDVSNRFHTRTIISDNEFLKAPSVLSSWNVQWNQLMSFFSCHQRFNEEAELEQCRCLIARGCDESALRRALNEMSRKTEAPPLDKVACFLARTNPSSELHSLYQQGIQVSSLSMALLVKIAVFSIPETVHDGGVKFLEEVWREVSNIIYSIEATNHASRETRQRIKLAKAVLQGNGFDTDNYNSKILMYKNEDEAYTEFTRASLIISHLKDAIGSSSDYMSREVGSITELISRREHTTIESIYVYIEQVFVDMLHLFLAQIPNVIMKKVTECPMEDFEEKVTSSLKLLRNIGPLENHVQWLFPSGCRNLSCLITNQLSANV